MSANPPATARQPDRLAALYGWLFELAAPRVTEILRQTSAPGAAANSTEGDGQLGDHPSCPPKS